MKPALGRVASSQLVQVLSVVALATALGARSAQSDELPLRVCADPNNLPFSNSAGEGFENKIAGLVADTLHRPLEFVWRAQRRGFVREGLNAGECDLVAAIPSGVPMALTTRPYYRSTYVFVSKPGEPPVSSLDDPSLKTRTIGVQLIGDNGMNSPPAHALAERGIVENVRGFMVYGDYRDDHPLSEVVRCGRQRRGRRRGRLGSGGGLLRAQGKTAARGHPDRRKSGGAPANDFRHRDGRSKNRQGA